MAAKLRSHNPIFDMGADVRWTGHPVEAPWPSPWDLPLHQFGADDGTAMGLVLPGCHEVMVVDGSEALTMAVDGDAPLSTAVWRNLGGYPPGAPYRSTGVEPLVGGSFDRRDNGRAATIPAAGFLSWTLRCTAWRRSS